VSTAHLSAFKLHELLAIIDTCIQTSAIPRAQHLLKTATNVFYKMASRQ